MATVISSLPGNLARDIHEEIVKGLPHSRERRDEAARAIEFYNGDFTRYPVRPKDSSYKQGGKPRHSLLLQRVVNVLTSNLYKAGPKRTLPEHAEAQAWVENVYRRNSMDAMIQQADRFSTAADVAALQVMGTEDAMRPIDVQLWDSSEFEVWLDPDNQRRPVAVATLDLYDHQRRCRLWTAETVTTYLSKRLEDGQTAGGTVYIPREAQDNELGLIPFTFVHFNMPVCRFWSSGPGSFLADANECANGNLTQTGDFVEFSLRPPIVGKNIKVGWRPPSPIRAGDVWTPPAASDSGGESDGSMELAYLEANSSVVVASWEDLNNYLDHTLEMCGVPPVAIRMVQDSARSGESIKAEQAPLVMWAESRQRPFAYYEDELMRLVLQVGAAHFGSQEYEVQEALMQASYTVTAQQLAEAAAEPGLILRWPKMYPEMPGADQDLSDGWLLDNKLASKTVLLMRREKMTREEAQDYLEEVAEDLKREQELFADVTTAEVQTALRAAGKPDPAEDDPNADDNEPAVTEADEEKVDESD